MLQKLKGTIAFWSCMIIVVMNLLETRINFLFTTFWIVMAAYFTWVSWGDEDAQ